MQIEEELFLEILDAAAHWYSTLHNNAYRSDFFKTHKEGFISKDKNYFYRATMHYSMRDKILSVIDDRNKTAFFIMSYCWRIYIDSCDSGFEQNVPNGILSVTSCEKLLNISDDTVWDTVKVYSESWNKTGHFNSRWEYYWWRQLTGFQAEWLRRISEAESYFRNEREKYASGPSYIERMQEESRKEKNQRDVEHSRQTYNYSQKKMFGDFWFTIPRAEREYRTKVGHNK